MYVYKFSMGSLNSMLMFIIDEKLQNALFSPPSKEILPSQAMSYNDNIPSNVNLSSNEMNNISLIMDVKLPVRVRIV